MIWGQGTNSCGRWLEERKKDSLESATLTVWVVGFLTAYNVYVAPSGDVLEGTDVDGAVAWIDNYCTAHPLETVASASEALVRALAPKRR